jgi:ATP-dependent Lon protease
MLSFRLQKIIEKYFIGHMFREMRQNQEKMYALFEGLQNGQSSLTQPKDETAEAQKNIQLILDVVLHLPDKTKPLTYVPAEIDKAFFGYTPDVAGALQRYCIRQTAASKAATVRKVVAYFWGPPGTGKTRAAGCIADALKLPFETLSLSKITPEDLVGTEDKPGLLLDVMTRAGRNGKDSLNNMVLLLDDADRVLNRGSHASSFILNLLEPETKSFYSPFLQSHVDISHLCIILAGNSEIQDEALRSRLQVVRFEGYNADYKKAVVWKSMLPELIKIHETSELPLTFADVEKDSIDKLIQADKDPGFRSIKQKVMEYLEDLVLRKHFPVSTKLESSNVSSNVSSIA